MNIKYINRIVLLGLILSIGLTSCQFTNKYKSPEVDTESLFRDSHSTDTTSIANIPWQEYFSDPILRGLIQEGLVKNHDFLATNQTIKIAEASLGMARAAYFPNLSLVGNVDHTVRSIGTDGKKHVLGGARETGYTLGIAASWEADIWGKLNRESRSKYADFMASHAYRDLIQTSLISNIATTYYTLLALDEQLKITNETIELLEESTETMTALKDAGMLNGAAVEQSKGLLYGTKVSAPTLEAQIHELENSISLLLGRKPGRIERSSIAQQAVPSQMDYGIPMQMLAKRPDVRQAELAFRNAFELTNAAQASFYPSINISATLGFGTGQYLSNFFKPENLFANIVGSLTQPIFARKQLTTNLKIRKAQQEETYIRFEQSVLSASGEVSDIVFGYKSSLRKNANRNQQVKALGTAVDYTQQLLTAGISNYTEVLNAERDLLQAQLGQVGDKLEQLQYSVNLYRALGGGLK